MSKAIRKSRLRIILSFGFPKMKHDPLSNGHQIKNGSTVEKIHLGRTEKTHLGRTEKSPRQAIHPTFNKDLV